MGRRLVTLGLIAASSCAPSAAAVTPVPAAPEHEPEPSPDVSTVAGKPAYDNWIDELDVLEQMRGPSGERDAGEPDAMSITALVEEPSVVVELVQSAWTDESHSWVSRRVHLLVRTVAGAAVVEIARQYRERVGDEGHYDIKPVVGQVQWRRADGPDLVLTAETRSVWGTQCDDGRDDRTDVIVCDVDGTVRCGRAPMKLTFFDGCAGAEVYDRDPRAAQDRCGRIGFSADWTTGADGLTSTLTYDDDSDCLDAGSSDFGDPRPPVPSPIDRATLFAEPYAVPVVTIAAP